MKSFSSSVRSWGRICLAAATVSVVAATTTTASAVSASATTWTQVGADIYGDAVDDYSGDSVSISADGLRMAIGAPYSGSRRGRVRVYEWRSNAWVQLGTDINGEATGDFSGWSVSLSADGARVAIGAYFNNGSGNRSGHVRIYEWRTNAWVQLGADIDGEAAADESGRSVSLSADGSRVAIGAPVNGSNWSISGHVRVFSWNGSAWVQVGADIDGEAAGDSSGESVSLSGDGARVAIGAPLNSGNGSNSGQVRVFSWNGSAWVKLGADIDGEAASDRSSESVSLSGDGSRVVIGAHLNDGNGSNSGQVRVFSWNGSAWVQLGTDIDGEAAGDFLGSAVSLSGDGSRVVIGAPYNDGNGSNAGQVRVYQLNVWTQVGADIDGEATGDWSGVSVSLSADGSRMAIGANLNDGGFIDSGHVRVYESRNGAWVQLGNDINGEAADDSSGVSVSLSGDGSRVAIGANWNDAAGNDSGQVRVFEWRTNVWVQLGTDIDGEAALDWSGESISLSADGARIAIGAPLNDGNGSTSGHVRVYEWRTNMWVQLGADIDGEAANNRSGSSVSLSANGSRVAIGAPWNAGSGASAGHTRVYSWNGTAWLQVGADIDGEAAGDTSGWAVSLSADGSRVAIGAPYNDGNGANAGHTRVYSWNGGAWSLVTTDNDGEGAGDLSGWATSLSSNGQGVAIGAMQNDGRGSNSGHVRVYGTVQTVVVLPPTPAPSPANPQQTPTPVTPTPSPVQALSAPSSVSYRTGNSQVTLQWGAVTGAASYVVTTSDGAQVCATTTTSCTINKLRNGRAYNYNVFAVNANGVRSTTGAPVSVRAGFQVKTTSVNARRAVSLSSIVTTPSRGTKMWAVTSGGCRVVGARFSASPRAGSCRLRLSTAKSGAYAAMSTTITVTIR